ncbi:MazG nucleotide pyrophosphohydrolase domain-containing protein [Frankia sp. B2]|uniref:MazG nucleotide pyrophosphohydrolase domain-containing protein n=1 Tax=Frankia sp. B2 TaxID=2541730 RepID=UPI00141B87AA|nr:MazG nucleotide pyrophosphohydrolase domain-containing protein [Frankia sp. B2]
MLPTDVSREAIHGPLALVYVAAAAVEVVTVPAHVLGDGSIDGVRSWRVRRIVVPGVETGVRYLAPATLKAHLRAGRGLSDARPESMGPLLPDLDRSSLTFVDELTSALPGYLVGGAVLSDWLRGKVVLETMVDSPASYTTVALEQLREIQRTALSVYGRLEPERALSWTIEELGELSQAMRRREHPVRLQEELGQLFSWLLCLANICEVDLAGAAAQALRHEALRQADVHGALKPYQSGGFHRC